MLVPEHLIPVLDSAGVGTPGVDLFCHRLPADIERGTMVTGNLAGTDIDHELTGWRQGRIQVIVRDPDHEDGMVRTRAVMAALSLVNVLLPATAGAPEVFMRRLRPIHDPIVYPRSDGDLIEFSVNFEGVWVDRG